ncbi:MAG: hypothetical protein AB7S48_01880 [Bacteroidales bacterium]
MSIRYKGHEQYPDSILIREFTGKVDVHEIIKSWDYLLNNQLITPKTKGVINNLGNCELNMSMEDFAALMDYLKSHPNLKRLKLAVICDNPKIIIFPIMGEFKQKDLTIKPFTTEKAAVSWIVEDE